LPSWILTGASGWGGFECFCPSLAPLLEQGVLRRSKEALVAPICCQKELGECPEVELRSKSLQNYAYISRISTIACLFVLEQARGVGIASQMKVLPLGGEKPTEVIKRLALI
jgi:hypothetical protein